MRPGVADADSAGSVPPAAMAARGARSHSQSYSRCRSGTVQTPLVLPALNDEASRAALGPSNSGLDGDPKAAQLINVSTWLELAQRF